MLIAILAVLLAGSIVYCLLAAAAALKHVRKRPSATAAKFRPISVLKPLAGSDDGLEANLRSFFEQDYPDFELLFAVHHASDPAAEIIRRLAPQYSTVKSKLIVTGDPPYPHGKVFSLQSMLNEAKHDLIVMSDSDIRVGKDFCRAVAADFEDPQLGLVTYPYRAVAGKSLWSRLEAIGMNADFHAGVLIAIMLEGMNFAVGPTIVARKHVLLAIGGVESVKDYVSSEDFMLGRIVASQGHGVALSSYVVEHRIGSETLRQNFAHRLRWARTTRRSRPWGYIGQIFTHPLVSALCASVAHPKFWLLLPITFLIRSITAWAVCGRFLRTRLRWHLLPLQDLIAFAFWVAGFFGNSIEWRGNQYLLSREGTIENTAAS